MSTEREVLVVIPTYVTPPEDLEVVFTTLETLRRGEPDCPVLVVDDGSPAGALVDEIEAASERLNFGLVRKDVNEGFAMTVNVGLLAALHSGMDAVLANADLSFITARWTTAFQRQQGSDGEPAAVVGARLLYPNGLIQHAGIYFSVLHRVFAERYKYAPADLPEAHETCVLPVTGALQFIRWETLRDVGVYDENFLLGWEDVDYCIRVFLADRECVYQPAVCALHHESMFRGRPSPKIEDWQARSWLYFAQKHKRTSFVQYVPTLI